LLPAQLATSYDPASVEEPTYQRWMDLGVFDPDPTSGRPPFTIVIPPPNVTGSLHLGHAFQHTLMDALTRRKRMQGFDAPWLPGMDHAGIATQNVVERELAGQSRRDLGREAFVARVWRWKEEYGGKILGQMRRLDERLSRAVRTLFKRLHDDGGLPRRADHELVSAVPDRLSSPTCAGALRSPRRPSLGCGSGCMT